MAPGSRLHTRLKRKPRIKKPITLITADAVKHRRGPARSTISPHKPAAASAMKNVIDDERLTQVICSSHNFEMSSTLGKAAILSLQLAYADVDPHFQAQ